MTDELGETFFRTAGEVWKAKVRERNFKEVLDFAIGNYISLRAITASGREQDAALGMVYAAIENLLLKKQANDPAVGERPTCSFCGKDESQGVRLGAGPHAFICNECVDLFAEVFREPKE